MESKAGEWKTGTQALGLCMICGGEYEAGTRECPDCHVSLSVVRRCPNCRRIVSAKHTKCVYCRTSFKQELSKDLFPDELPAAEGPDKASPNMRRFRAAAVSIATFVFVFGIGLAFLHQMHKPGIQAHIIATSRVPQAARLRLSPSTSSSIVAQVTAGTAVSITGFKESDEGRWMILDWNNSAAYLPANDMSAPRAVEAGDGAAALKFYLVGMASPEAADEAIKAVDSYAAAFPGDAHSEELRWVLAERLRALSQNGGPQGATLRREASEQYEQVANLKGKFADKAKDTLVKPPSSGQARAPRTRVVTRKPDGIEIIGGSGTQTSTEMSAPHEALVLTVAEVVVHTGKLSASAEGTAITGHVASPVRANGIVAIPAGAPCQVTVVSSDPAGSTFRLQLTSIEIEHRSYAVKSPIVEIHGGGDEKQAAYRAVNFHLSAPLVIER